MGAVTQAMARACAGAGVTIRTDAAVARVLATAKRADGVELADGSRIGARIIVSNVHPKTLPPAMVPPDTPAPRVRPRTPDDRRVGTERVSTCRSPWSPAPLKNKLHPPTLPHTPTPPL